MPGWGELFVEEVFDNCGQPTQVQLLDDASSSMFIVFLLFIFPSQLTFWPFTSWEDARPSKFVDGLSFKTIRLKPKVFQGFAGLAVCSETISLGRGHSLWGRICTCW